MFGLDETIKNFLSGISANFLKEIFLYINKISEEVGAELVKSPESFNGQIFTLLESFSKNVVLPIGILLLTIVLVTNLCKSLLDEREMQNPLKVYYFFIITSVFAVILVINSFEITNFIINISQTTVDKALVLFDKNTTNLNGDITKFEETLKTMELSQVFGVFLMLILAYIIIWLVRVLVQIVILGRFIEIFMRLSIAPIAFSRFFNRDLSNTGFNFIKSMGAVTLQAVLIMVVIAIYRGTLSSIAVDVGTQESLTLFLIKILGINLTLVFMLFQTKRIADSILSVH